MNTARINYDNSVCTRNDEPICCDTEAVREVSMAEQLDRTRTTLTNAEILLEKLDAYIFGAKPTECLDPPIPECMRDAISNNEYLAGLVEDRLKRLVDRICV